MIKKFIGKVESLSTDAWLAILSYIDNELDKHDSRLDDLEERIDKFEEKFEPTRVEVESQTATRKLIKKTVVTTVIGAIVGFALRHFGVF